MFIEVAGHKLKETFYNFSKFYAGSVLGKVIKISKEDNKLVLSGIRSDYIEMSVEILDSDFDSYECLIEYTDISYILTSEVIRLKFMSTAVAIESDCGNIVIQYSYSDSIVKPHLNEVESKYVLNQYDLEKLKKLTSIEVLARALKKTFPVVSYGKSVVINTAMVAVQVDVKLPIGVFTIEQLKRIVIHNLNSVESSNRVKFYNSSMEMISTTSKLTEDNIFDRMLSSFEYLSTIKFDVKTIQSMSSVMRSEMVTVDICEDGLILNSSTDKFSINYTPKEVGNRLFRFSYSYQILAIILNMLGGECKVWKKGSVLCLKSQGLNIMMSV